MKDSFYKLVFCFLVSVFSLCTAKAQLGANVISHATTCGKNNGSAQVYPTGGVGGYTYAWSIAGIPNTQDSVWGLPSGNYTVTVYSGASDSIVPFVIGGPVAPGTLGSPAPVQPTCGQNSGSINWSVTGSGSTTELLRNDTLIEQGSQTRFPNLPPGTYTFIILSPGTACPVDTLTPVVLSDNSTYPVIDSIQITPEKCFGAKQGGINVFVSNCTGGCTYSWTGIPANTTTSASGLAAGTYTFGVTGGGCTTVDTVIMVPGPGASLSDSMKTHPSNCGQDNATATVLASGGTPPYTYQWSMGTPSGDSATNMPGNSTVNVTVTDAHGCVVIDTAALGSVPRPVVVVTPPNTICQGDNNGLIIVTPISADGPFNYIWSNFETTNVNAGLAPGLYSLTVTDAAQCDTVLQVIVPYYQAQFTVAYTPSGQVPIGQPVVIQLIPNEPVTNVQWSPYIPGSTGSLEVTLKPTQDSIYTVIVTFGNGCKAYDTLGIYVVPPNNNDEWTIPNTFTPNGDGINDNFKIIGNPYLTSFHIWIFDRWGNKVFESTQGDFLWNGSDQFAGNKPVNSGVFSYLIEYQTFTSDSKGKIGGNVTLIR